VEIDEILHRFGLEVSECESPNTVRAYILLKLMDGLSYEEAEDVLYNLGVLIKENALISYPSQAF